MGYSASISLVPAAEPRMSTPPTVPSGHRMTVHPVQPTVVRPVSDPNSRYGSQHDPSPPLGA